MSVYVRRVKDVWFVRVNAFGRRLSYKAVDEEHAKTLAGELRKELLAFQETGGNEARSLAVKVVTTHKRIKQLQTDEIRADHIPPALLSLYGKLRLFNEERAVVYFLCEKDAVQYVGKTCSLAFRVRAHERAGIIPFDRVLYVEVEGANAGDVESAFIKLLRPEYNGTRSTLDPETTVRTLREYGIGVRKSRAKKRGSHQLCITTGVNGKKGRRQRAVSCLDSTGASDRN